MPWLSLHDSFWSPQFPEGSLLGAEKCQNAETCRLELNEVLGVIEPGPEAHRVLIHFSLAP